MPPRKSTGSNPPEDVTEASVTTPAQKSKDKDGLGVEDLTLPKSMIARLAKGVLPPNTQIQKDALLALHKSATVFVSYIASNANDLAHMGGKKTISPQDVLAALKDAELEDVMQGLDEQLKKYNEIQCDKRNSYRHRVKQEKAIVPGEAAEGENGTAATPTAVTAAEGSNSANGINLDDDTEPPSKKLKGDGGEVVVTPGGQLDDYEGDDGEPDGDDDGDEGDDVDDVEQDGEDDVEDEVMADGESEEDEDGVGVHGPDEALDDGEDSD